MKRESLNYYFIELPNFLALFTSAFFFSLTNPILIEVSESLNSSPENVILIVSFHMLGSCLGMVISPIIIKRIKKFYIFLVYYILLLPLIFTLISSNFLIVFYIIYFLTGYIFGTIFILVNFNMVESKIKNKNSVINLGHSFVAIGAILGPILAQSFISAGINWKFLYFFIISTIILNIVLFILLRRKVDSSIPLKNNSIKIIFANKKTNYFLFLTTVTVFFYIIAEAVVITWSPTFLRLQKLFSPQNASFAVIVFWIGILLGRIFCSYLTYKMKSYFLLLILSTVSFTALFFLPFSNIMIISYFALFFIGLGFSGIVPLLISSTSSFFSEGKDLIITLLFLITQISYVVAPFIMRSISRINMVFSVGITIIFMGVVIILIFIRYLYHKHVKTEF